MELLKSPAARCEPLIFYSHVLSTFIFLFTCGFSQDYWRWRVQRERENLDRDTFINQSLISHFIAHAYKQHSQVCNQWQMEQMTHEFLPPREWEWNVNGIKKRKKKRNSVWPTGRRSRAFSLITSDIYYSAFLVTRPKYLFMLSMNSSRDVSWGVFFFMQGVRGGKEGGRRGSL